MDMEGDDEASCQLAAASNTVLSKDSHVEFKRQYLFLSESNLDDFQGSPKAIKVSNHLPFRLHPIQL
jgi:hypothetical protein